MRDYISWNDSRSFDSECGSRKTIILFSKVSLRFLENRHGQIRSEDPQPHASSQIRHAS